MNNTLMIVVFYAKNKLRVLKANFPVAILFIFSLNSFAQPPLDVTKEKEIKQPPITQPPLPPPPTPTDYKITVLQLTPCNDNIDQECLVIKRFDKSKIETVRIKNFKYDERYTYTLLVKELKESAYKYSWVKTISKIPKIQSSYTIIIEKNGLDDYNYIRYKKEGESVLTSLPKEYYKGVQLIPGTRYVLKVKEVVENNQTYLQVVEQVEPPIYKQKADIIITVEPFIDYHNIQYSYTKNGVEILETLNDSFIVGISLQKNVLYKLKVKDIGTDYTKFKLIERILPKDIEYTDPSDGIVPSTVFYNCNSEEQRIATNNDVIYTNYMLEDDHNIEIKPVDKDIPFYKFYGNICGFTFVQDHKYVLEVKKEGNDYKLIRELCNTKMNYTEEIIKKYSCDGPDYEMLNPGDENRKKDANIPDIPKPRLLYKINHLDSAIWHLRYLYDADGVEPHNFTEDDNKLYFSISFDKFFNKAKGNAPCSSFEAKLLTNESDKFDCYNLIASERKCDVSVLQQLFFNQLQTVNKYDIIDNKLRLFKDSKMLLLFEGFAIK